jgi:Gram-negative bacterial TonB protein C-terminal
MRSRFTGSLLVFALSLASAGWCQSAAPGPGQSSTKSTDVPENPQALTKVPSGVILVKGAWSSASDSVTPVPEGASVTSDGFIDEYFGITYPLPKGWTEKYKGPPPSDSGRYVLAQIQAADAATGTTQGHILVTAQDMFFTPLPTKNALALTTYEKSTLGSDYKLEVAPKQTNIAGRPFTFYAYQSPVAELHWYVLATEIRCHAVEFVLTSRDTKLLASLVADMNRMKLPAEASPSGGDGGGAFPVCIQDYASDEHLVARVDPILTEHRFTPVPVRIIIDKDGKVKHIHFLSAFPDQSAAITAALQQWKFKPYRRDGQPVEVETGIMFGRAPPHLASSPGPKPSIE